MKNLIILGLETLYSAIFVFVLYYIFITVVDLDTLTLSFTFQSNVPELALSFGVITVITGASKFLLTCCSEEVEIRHTSQNYIAAHRKNV